jgi:hypothetical protein
MKSMCIAGGSIGQLFRVFSAENAPLVVKSDFLVSPEDAWIDSSRLNLIMYGVQPTMAQYLGALYSDKPGYPCIWVDIDPSDIHAFIWILSTSIGCAVFDMHQKRYICGYAGIFSRACGTFRFRVRIISTHLCCVQRPEAVSHILRGGGYYQGS